MITITVDQRLILAHVHMYAAPVALTDLIHDYINPAGMDTWEGQPRHDEWIARQIHLQEVALDLTIGGYVRTVYPANGFRPDLVELTDKGREAAGDAGALVDGFLDQQWIERAAAATG